jgi:glutathione S-transferase
MIIVHYLENSRAHRVLWLLEELGLTYDIRRYPRGSDMRAPEALKKIHPLGKSPIIEDNGVVIAESGAIFDYLLRTYGRGGLSASESAQDQRDYVYWMNYAEGSAMPLLVMTVIFRTIPRQLPFFLRPLGKMISSGVEAKLLQPQLNDHVAFWEKSLGRTGWFAGDQLTAADIMMSFPVETAVTRAPAADHPAIKQFLQAIRARPAYRSALEKGGPYIYAGTETAGR